MKVLFNNLTSYKHGDLVLESSYGRAFKANLRFVKAGARPILFSSYKDVWGIK